MLDDASAGSAARVWLLPGTLCIAMRFPIDPEVACLAF